MAGGLIFKDLNFQVDDAGQVQQLFYNDDGVMCDWTYRLDTAVI